MGRPIGSQNKDKPFREALRIEAALADAGKRSPAKKGSLRWIVRRMLERAGDETNAAREIADRLDGKVPQALAGSVDIGVTDPLAALLREINGKTRGLPDT